MINKKNNEILDAMDFVPGIGLSEFSVDDDIPKIIWTYWHSEKIPLIVQKCIDGWRRFNPDYKINFINEINLRNYLDEVPNEIYGVDVTKRADWIRLALLKKYGGVWIDASIILTRDLNWVDLEAKKYNANYIGFYLKGYTKNNNYPVIENWFMASSIDNEFINQWYDIFNNFVIKQGTDQYLNYLSDNGYCNEFYQGINDPYYHTMHVAAQHVMRNHSTKKLLNYKNNYRLHLLCAENSAYFYHTRSNWNRRSLFFKLLWNKINSDYPSLIKLRGGERRKINFFLKNKLFRKNTIADIFLNR